ncbi:MAG: hydrogenase maturation protease [Myxococcales bacterium]
MHLLLHPFHRFAHQRVDDVVSAHRATLLILGLGNPMRGDDGFGSRVLEELGKQALPAATQLLDAGTAGLEIVLELMDRESVLIVDTARFGGSPGEVRRFDLWRCELPRVEWNAGHAHGLAAAVELSKALGVCPRHLNLYAVEPLDTSEVERLSAPVERAVPVVVAQVLEDLRR